MSRKNRADAYFSESHHQRHIERQSQALERRLKGVEGARLGVPARSSKGRLPELEHFPDFLRRPEQGTGRRIGQVAPKFSELLGVAKDITDAFSVEDRWRSTMLVKEYIGRMLMPGERVWVELVKPHRTSLRFAAIRIRSGNDALLQMPAEKSDAIADLLSKAEGSRAYAADPPSLFRMEGSAVPVERCTFDNPSGKPLRAERSNEDYRRMENELMRLYGIQADEVDADAANRRLP